MSRKLVATSCAAAAVFLSGAAVVATIARHDWNVTTLIRMQPNEKIAGFAREVHPDFVFVPHGHFDGVYYYAIANDPLARDEAHELIDRPAYRYGHAGYGWLAWLLSLGRARAVPWALLVLGLVGIALAAALGSMLYADYGLSPWAGILVAVNPGLLFAVAFDTSESVGAAFLFGALIAWRHRRWRVAALLLTALCLVKEWFVLVPVAFGAWEIGAALRNKRSPDWKRRMLALVPAPLALGAWQLYLGLRFDQLPWDKATGNFDFPPLAGWVASIKTSVDLGFGEFAAVQLGYMSLPFLLAVGGLLLFGVAAALRLRSRVDLVYLLFAGVLACASWLILLYPKDLIRTITIPLLLLPIVLGGRADEDEATPA